ncbi:hypothetical protein BO70DRAFT_361719 [Aspergillus heteromorphus CBS 117.55]|uniref:Nephrocystin 3-like N-terminal domain-containing protein n=1 Tax=Aspergillus heteromorphus CBS 117.55 TaxID=1448321 RepID=A0A317WEH7_9EURO|nr:uncharacterized protein BO70DRAFT_361719 [Aspergillus heteromorphus CBS 117.55]PWY83637.1 hypothetical protein BO70DRAFT_361719 [Aspergillus heteromorphus CBS 117.55]
MALSMGSSDQKDYTVSAAAFISTEGPEIHPGLGGSSQYSVQHDRFMPVEFHTSLETCLRHYLPLDLGLEFPNDADKLEKLSERLAGAEDRYKGQKKGFWHSIWYHVGDGQEVVSNWLALIPNEYGLAVVKTGLAVVIKLAEKSAERRKKILDTFVAIRNALARADPEKRSFRAHKDVRACADSLTRTITQCIEELIKLTSKQKTSWREKLADVPKRKQRAPPSDPDGILEKLAKSTEEFEDVVTRVRDSTIEATGYMAMSITTALPVMHDDIRGTDDRLQNLDRKQDSRDEDYRMGYQNICTLLNETLANTRRIARRDENLQVIARTTMVRLLRESKRLEAENKMLRQQQRLMANFGAIVDESQLFEILTLASRSNDHELSDLAHMLRQPNADLQLALTYKGKLSQESQRKVQAAVVTDNRVLQWLQCPESDLIMADANAINPGISKISAISVFSATFITSMINARPADVVAHYFCGHHFRSKDPWHGPNGLVRFIAMQLLMRLMEMKRPNLSFIRSSNHVRNLEEHDLWTLCHLLHSIVAQFPYHVTVCLVIDSISCFDTSRTAHDLHIVMDHLHRIVTEESLRPTVKVFLTSPMHSSRAMIQSDVFQEDPTRIVRLIPNNSPLPLMDMSERLVGHMLFQD